MSYDTIDWDLVDELIGEVQAKPTTPSKPEPSTVTLQISRQTSKHVAASWEFFAEHKQLQSVDLELTREEAHELLAALQKALG